MWLEPQGNIPSEIAIGFSDMRLDWMRLPDDSEDRKTTEEILEMRRQALQETLSSGDVCILQQVHGARVVKASVGSIQIADAHWTDEPDLNLVVLTADCVPVFLCSSHGNVVAAVHCGWRGLANHVLRNAVDSLPIDPSYLSAFTGPAICGQCYEFGVELLPQLGLTPDSSCVQKLPNPSKCMLDLPKLVADQLRALGVQNIELSDQCTYHDSESYFSYRRESTVMRQASFIRIESTV